MNRLIKTELKKLFAKKMIYIFFAIVTVLAICYCIIEKDINKLFDVVEYDVNAQLYQDSLDSYDLKDPDQLNYYVDDKTYLDALTLAKNYKTYSAEHLYVYNTIEPTIRCMNENEYITKDQEKYNECKKQYDEQLDFLKHFDWKKQLLSEKADIENQIKEAEAFLVANPNDEDFTKSLKLLKLKLEVIEYRIEKGIPLDSNGLSTTLNTYVSSYEQYLSYDQDKKIVVRDELLEKKAAEATYFTFKYKFEHGMIRDTGRSYGDSNTATAVLDVFSGSTFAILFLILVAGGIIADEFNKGTIKQLLLKPYKRTKILFSKIFAVLITSFIFLIAFALVTALINGIIYGEFRSLFDPVVFYNVETGKIITHSLPVACLEALLAISPFILIMLGVSILLGALTTNTAVTIIVPIVLNTAASIINAFANSKVFAYFPTMCWNLSEFLHGGMPTFKYMKLSTSLIVDAVTIVLLFGFSILIFKKKDIKNQ